MSRPFLLRVSFIAALSVALAATPKLSFAQHGQSGGFGHGGGFVGHGGGGFHGGGFGSHGGLRDGHGFGGFGRGAGFGRDFGERGFGGFRHRPFFGGFPRYSFNFDFSFFPYWGYPYLYGYPWWAARYSYYYPYDYYDGYDGYSYDDPDYDYHRHRRCRPDYRYDDPCNDDQENHRRDRDYGPARPSGLSGTDYSDGNYVTSNFEDYRASIHIVEPAAKAASSYQFAYASVQKLPSGDIPSGLRPAVRNAIQTLRVMPPDARERQLGSDRYSNFSPEEREVVKKTVQ